MQFAAIPSSGRPASASGLVDHYFRHEYGRLVAVLVRRVRLHHLDAVEESRLVLALKTLCGFSTGEIAFRLFTTEANVYKRLARARERLRQGEMDTETPALESLRSRLPSVHAVIYLLFNEGYLSTDAEHAIRAELCEEAIRLGTLLATHPVGAAPPTFALLALLHLHAARLVSRQDATGGLLLLEEQDRSRWDTEHLRQGATWLERAGHGENRIVEGQSCHRSLALPPRESLVGPVGFGSAEDAKP